MNILDIFNLTGSQDQCWSRYSNVMNHFIFTLKVMVLICFSRGAVVSFKYLPTLITGKRSISDIAIIMSELLSCEGSLVPSDHWQNRHWV